jgi:hypothetical protein
MASIEYRRPTSRATVTTSPTRRPSSAFVRAVSAYDQVPEVMDDNAVLESLAPRSDAKYALALFMGAAQQARCVVSWTDTAGEYENVATLRFF